MSPFVCRSCMYLIVNCWSEFYYDVLCILISIVFNCMLMHHTFDLSACVVCSAMFCWIFMIRLASLLSDSFREKLMDHPSPMVVYVSRIQQQHLPLGTGLQHPSCWTRPFTSLVHLWPISENVLMKRHPCCVPWMPWKCRACVCWRQLAWAKMPRPCTVTSVGNKSFLSSMRHTTKPDLTWWIQVALSSESCLHVINKVIWTISKPFQPLWQHFWTVSKHWCWRLVAPWQWSTTRLLLDSMRCLQSSAQPTFPATPTSSSWKSWTEKRQRLVCRSCSTRSPLRESTAVASTPIGP